MLQDNSTNWNAGFRRIAFSPKVLRCLDRATRHHGALEKADWASVKPLIDTARHTMEIASDKVIMALSNWNPAVLQISRAADGIADGLLAVLPLNTEGAAALVKGALDGMSPNPNWVCRDGEQPEVIYIWLVFMPGTFGRQLGAIAGALESMLETDCPMFSRATTVHAERLHASAGFRPASDFYPGCKPGLQVVFPERRSLATTPVKSEIDVARTIEDVFQVFSVRSATYIAEQFCLYSEEFDGNDFCSTHLLGRIGGDAAGCIRLRFFDGFAKLERLAVRAEYRNTRLAYQLVRAALEHCRMKGYRKVYGHSRLDLVRFWRVFGFKAIEGRETFAFANVKYTELLLDQAAHPNAITLDADPMVVIRPEGAWHRPGPFDTQPSVFDARRKQLLKSRTRTVAGQNIVA
jgi:predicted GNAT family N-acyltransferase